MAYRKIEDGKLTAIANAIRSKLTSTATMTPDQMPEMIENIGIGVVPDYWKSYLATKATEINTALSAAGENKSAFLWYTDAHWTENLGQSPILLKYLSKHTGMKKTFFGGDIAVASSGELDIIRDWQSLVDGIPSHHSVIGNHDNALSAELPTAKDRADFFFDPERTGDVVFGTDATNGKMYYYIDNHMENTRYICLSTGRMWTTSDEIPWCIDVLNSTPTGWHIVIIGHLWLNSDYSDDGVTLIPTPPDYIQSYMDTFDAYNYKLTGTTSFESVAYDFTNAGAKIEFIIGGHVHRDYDFATAKGIPIILTECDAQYERDPESVATQGTTTENCVYAIVADYTAKAVKVIHVGRGSSRTLAIPDVVTYTNWAKKAIDTDGTIYNDGKGYKENCRLNSTGAEASYTGRCVTGFIPVRVGDIVRLENMDYMNMSATSDDGTIKFCFYKEDFSYSTNSSHYPNSLPSSAWSPVYREDGNVKQVTVPTAYGTAVRYMRISAKNINENSIITVNEPIE